MRDRLIELIDNKQEYGLSADSPPEQWLVISNEDLADYLLANGVIVPPCKVGQKLYCIIEGFDEVMEGSVRQFIVAEGIFIDCVIRGYFNQVFHSCKIGKTVFLTKEEAEQALKGGEGDVQSVNGATQRNS